MPKLALLPFLAGLLVLSLPGCGSGSGTGAPLASAPQAQVLGVVISRDGSSAELDGVVIEGENGERLAVTDQDGRFEAPVPAGRRFRLRFHDPRAQGSVGDDDVREADDDTPDGTDIDGDELEIDELDEDEVCEVEVELENGDLAGSWVERRKQGEDGEERREHDGETHLYPPEGKVEGGPRGELELGGDDDCMRLEIEAEGLADYDLLEAVIELPDGTQETLDALVIDDEGEVHFVFEACGADEMPFGVEGIEGLAESTLLIVDDLDNVILTGPLPMRRGEHDDDDEHEGKEDDDHEKGEKPDARVEDFALAAPGEGSEAVGGGVVKVFPTCSVLVVEIGHVDAAEYALLLVDESGDEVSLGTIEVDEEGQGRFAEEYGEDVPFDAASLEDLAGYTILIVDADAVIILEGTLPAFPAEEGSTDTAE